MTQRAPHRPPLDRARLARVGAPWTVEVVDEVTSTSSLLADHAAQGAEAGLVVVAEHQSAGRGRLDRAWVSPARSGLTFSVLMRPSAAAHRWTWLPLMAGLAVIEGVAAASGPPCRLKWPNDVLCGDRKVGGLLAERVETAQGPAAVVGVGLNVDTTPDELPVETATSLTLAGMAGPDRSLLLVEVLTALAARYTAWVRAEGAARTLIEDYTDACATLGRRVQVALPDGRQLVGRATGVDDDGALIVRSGAADEVVRAGDVVHVRTGSDASED